jgi:hypothetical protein
MELHEMYSPDEVKFIIRIAGKRHLSMYPEERNTRCGIPLEGTDWEIKSKGFQGELRTVVGLSNREDLLEMYNPSDSCFDLDAYCSNCLDSLSEGNPYWQPILDHPWQKKGDSFSHLKKEVLVAKLPRNHVLGWVTVKTKPRQYTYQSGGRGGFGWRRGALTKTGPGISGETKTSWHPSRTYDTPMVYASSKNADIMAKYLLDLKDEKKVDSISAELELHHSEDLFLLCSRNEHGFLHFCHFITFTPPPEEVKIEILSAEDLETIYIKEIMPVLEPLNDIVKDES